jgi:hypothetical protein
MIRRAAIIFLIIGLLLWASWSWAAEPVNTPITENERQSLVVGMVLGIDMAQAHDGNPPLSYEEWTHFAQIFNKITLGCTDMQCLSERVVKFRTKLMKLNQPPLPPVLPKVPQVEKELM